MLRNIQAELENLALVDECVTCEKYWQYMSSISRFAKCMSNFGVAVQ